MASNSSSRPSTSRRQSSANTFHSAPSSTTGAHATDLAESLQKLTLLTSPASARSPRSPGQVPSFRNQSSNSLASPSPASNPRLSPRSPSMGRTSRASTPSLVRKSSTSSLRSPSVGPRQGQSLSRRASSANLSSSTPRSPLAMAEPPFVEPKPVLTANSIAKDFFAADLQGHQENEHDQAAGALVILHDSCYGHQFSRPSASADDLATIVERPERLRACALGIAAAYVKLGGRHADGQYPIHPKLDPKTIPDAPFRIRRVTRKLPITSPAVVGVHGKPWMEELRAMCLTTRARWAKNECEILRDDANLRPGQQPKPKFHPGDLYLAPESLDAMEGALGAVCEAVDQVFTSGPRRCFVSIRPPGHHCSEDFPSGFCWVNNVHVGIAHAMMNHGLTHAAIIDFDLHHGDGSQSIAWSHNHRSKYNKRGLAKWRKTSIGYFSLHDINSFPCEYGDPEKVMNASICIDNAHGQNIWNVHLQPWSTEPEFWEIYNSSYSVLIDKAAAYLKTQTSLLRKANIPPKSAIFFSAGFDASQWEGGGMQRHSVQVPTDFYARITRDAVALAMDPDTAAEGRVISVMEGGYSDRAIASGVLSHLSGLVARPIAQNAFSSENDIKEEDVESDGGVPAGIAHDPLAQNRKRRFSSNFAYDSAWWSGSELDKLDRAIATPVPLPKKPRHAVPPTYSSPTHASTAKALDPANLRRSLSGLNTSNGLPSRPPTPPPPEVPWPIATQELFKLLVPEDRRTLSLTHAEIGEVAAQCKLDFPALQKPVGGSQLAHGAARVVGRDRKTKPVEPIREEEGTEKLAKGRRKTTAVGFGLPPAKSGGLDPPVRRSARRASTASVLLTAEDESVIENATNPASDGLGEVSGNGNAMAPPVTKPVPSVQTKKVRAPASAKEPVPRIPKTGTRGPAAKKSPAKTTKAGPRSANTSQAATPKRPTPEKAEIKVSGPGNPPESTDKGLDQITSGLNQIRISLVSKSRETGAPVAAKPMPRIRFIKSGQNSGTTSPDPLGPNDVLPSASVRNEGYGDVTPPIQSPLEPLPSLIVRTPVEEKSMSDSIDSLEPSSSSPLPSSPPTFSPPNSLPKLRPETPDKFVQYQPEGPTPVAVPMSEPVRFLPPNVAATPTPMNRSNLPAFTPTSTLRFAPPSYGGGEDKRGFPGLKPESSSK